MTKRTQRCSERNELKKREHNQKKIKDSGEQMKTEYKEIGIKIKRKKFETGKRQLRYLRSTIGSNSSIEEINYKMNNTIQVYCAVNFKLFQPKEENIT